MQLLNGCKFQSWSATVKQKLENVEILSLRLWIKHHFKSLLLILGMKYIVSPTWLTGIDTVWTGADKGWTAVDDALEVSRGLVAALVAGGATFMEVSAGFRLLCNINQKEIF